MKDGSPSRGRRGPRSKLMDPTRREFKSHVMAGDFSFPICLSLSFIFCMVRLKNIRVITKQTRKGLASARAVRACPAPGKSPGSSAFCAAAARSLGAGVGWAVPEPRSRGRGVSGSARTGRGSALSLSGVGGDPLGRRDPTSRPFQLHCHPRSGTTGPLSKRAVAPELDESCCQCAERTRAGCPAGGIFGHTHPSNSEEHLGATGDESGPSSLASLRG